MTTMLTTISQVIMAQAEGGGDGSGAPGSPFGAMGGFLPILLMFAVVYFLLIRPAGKQRKEHQQLLSALKKDDEVVTSGGVYGRIVGIDERIVTLEIADRVKIKILRDRIAGRWAQNKAVEQKK